MALLESISWFWSLQTEFVFKSSYINPCFIPSVCLPGRYFAPITYSPGLIALREGG